MPLEAIRSNFPYALQIELTSHCNLKCVMCPLTTGSTLSSARSGPMMSLVWKQVLEAAAQTGQVIVTGFGESLTSTETLPRLRELDALGVQIGLTTNGTPLTPAISRELAALPNLVHVNVSIDSPDPKIYHDIRVGDVNKALRGVGNLVKAMPNPARVTVSSVMMASNLESLVRFPPILKELGVRTWILQGLIDYTGDQREEGLRFLDVAHSHLEAIREASRAAGIALDVALPSRTDLELRDPGQAGHTYYETSSGGGTRQCCLPWETPFIDKDGKVFPCCFASSSRSAVLGDLNTSSFAEVWESVVFRDFRKAILHADTTPPVCRACNVVPLGEHPLSLYGAELIPAASDLTDPSAMRIVARNTGRVPWTRETPVRIGTTSPRDRRSQIWHKSWLDITRVATFEEAVVAPGEVATFRFRVAKNPRAAPEAFALLVDGAAWLPNTRFTIYVAMRWRPLRVATVRLGRVPHRLGSLFRRAFLH